MNLFSFKVLRALILMMLAGSWSLTHASLVTVEFNVNINSAYDYPTGSYVSIAPIFGTGSFTFNIDDRSVIDYGTTTVTTFGGVMGTTWNSPVTALIPNDPYSGAYGPFYNSYTFPNVSDYPSDFIEQGASQANTYKVAGNENAYYHIELRATKRSAPRNGDGTSDYAFSGEGLLDFYRSFVVSGDDVYFNESYAIYTVQDGAVNYSEGRSWDSYTATITNVIDQAAVPEPSTVYLILLGLMAAALLRRKVPRAQMG